MSDAMRLLHLLWDGCSKSAPASWERLNRTMADALRLAIAAGLRFDTNDFAEIYDQFNGGYWFGADSGEAFYAIAVISGHLEACRSYETFRNRPAFICDNVSPDGRYGSCGKHSAGTQKRGRVAVGFSFRWKGEKVTVTSIGRECFIACSYEKRTAEFCPTCSHCIGIKGSRKATRRYKITPALIQAVRKAAKNATM